MKHFYKIGGHVLCATNVAKELTLDSLGEYKKMVFTDDTVVRVVKDGDKNNMMRFIVSYGIAFVVLMVLIYWKK